MTLLMRKGLNMNQDSFFLIEKEKEQEKQKNSNKKELQYFKQLIPKMQSVSHASSFESWKKKHRICIDKMMFFMQESFRMKMDEECYNIKWNEQTLRDSLEKHLYKTSINVKINYIVIK